MIGLVIELCSWSKPHVTRVTRTLCTRESDCTYAIPITIRPGDFNFPARQEAALHFEFIRAIRILGLKISRH